MTTDADHDDRDLACAADAAEQDCSIGGMSGLHVDHGAIRLDGLVAELDEHVERNARFLVAAITWCSSTVLACGKRRVSRMLWSRASTPR